MAQDLKGVLMENWKPILGFYGYSVSDQGRVRNDDTGRLMTIVRNQGGTCYVGLTKGRKQNRRSLPLLVANAFVPPVRDRIDFDTVIHLDNDQSNNRADNLLWRPHWFVIKYHIQHNNGPLGKLDQPVMDLNTREIYSNTWEVATTYGLIEKDLILSILNRTFVWPTFKEFRFVE